MSKSSDGAEQPVKGSTPKSRTALATWDDWLGTAAPTIESKEYRSMGMSKQRAVGGKNFRLNYPFTRSSLQLPQNPS